MAAPVTQAEREALMVGDVITPHPDGEPWAKCCRSMGDNDYSCQCFMRKPKKSKSRYENTWKKHQLVTRLIEEGGRFFCVHRKDGGCLRECAGWAAMMKGNKKAGA